MKAHLAALLVIGSLANLSAQAGSTITFSDTNPNDTVTITPGNFTTFTGGGVLNESAAGLPYTGTFASSFNGFNQVSFYLVEANNPAVVSDILTVTTVGDGTTSTVSGNFFSDMENNLGPAPTPGPNLFVNTETGPIAFTNRAIGLTVTIDSDPETPAVPEPASLTLLGIGIAGMAGYGWRRRKQA